jgi:arylsulfatase A
MIARVSRMHLLLTIIPCCLVMLASPASSAGESSTPNVVLILADDLGIGDLPVYNAESKIRTPNMNHLASEGVRFTDMHTPSSVCTPTRYALLTGRYCWRTTLKKGVLWGFSPLLIEPGRMTLASMLKAKGYHTAAMGKWHLGLGTQPKTDYSQPFNAGPLTVGFDQFLGIPASLDMEPYVWVVNDHVEAAPTENIAASKHRRQNGGGFWRAGPIAPGFKHVEVLPRLTREAGEHIAARAKEKTPFFLYLALNAPHTPWMPSPEFEGKSAVGYYGDYTEQTDASVGAVLKAIDAAGIAENTLVILTSDNGSHWPAEDIKQWNHRANWYCRGQKSDIHDGGHRVPFIVRWPGVIQPGGVCDKTATLTDVAATLAAVVGAELPDNAAEDSFSLLPLLKDPAGAPAVRDAAIHHSGDGMFAIRMGEWKLIEGLGSGGFTAPKFIKPKDGEPIGQLYNLKDDPSETANLYGEKPEIVARLLKRLNEIRDNGRSR